MAARQLSQSTILHRLGIPTTQAELNRISGSGKLQQYINQQATLHGLPQPFNPSLASAIVQDLLPFAVLAGAATLPADTAGGGAEATAGGAAASGGIASSAGKGAVSGAASDIVKAAGVASFAALLTDPSFLFRALKFIGGLLLAYIGIKQLAAAGGGSSGGRPGRLALA